jgi:hypothetical protein
MVCIANGRVHKHIMQLVSAAVLHHEQQDSTRAVGCYSPAAPPLPGVNKQIRDLPVVRSLVGPHGDDHEAGLPAAPELPQLTQGVCASTVDVRVNKLKR